MTATEEIRHEAMRIGGEKVFTDDVVEVRYPYTDEVIPRCRQALMKARTQPSSPLVATIGLPAAMRAT